MTIKILLAGDGGQGIQTIANLLTQTAFASQYYVSNIPNFGLEQRGGVSLAFVQISDQPIVYPKFTKPDILLIMSAQAEQRTGRYQQIAGKLIQVGDYLNRLLDEKINKQSYNIFFLGLLGKFLAEKNIIKIDDLNQALANKLSSRQGWEENSRAFDLGANISGKH